MSKKLTCAVALTLMLLTSAVAQQLDPPKLTPSPSTEQQSRLIREGIALHDRRDYDGAIAKYEEVLKENPDNVLALYEQTFSLSSKKDYRKSLEVAYKGAQYKSEHVAAFYMMIGNDLDVLGESAKAVDVYKKGIKLMPNMQLLYYNLALTYKNLNKLDDAKKNYKTAAFLNPNHASTHVALATLFHRTQYKIPAFFAVSRFLILEPRSGRSPEAFRILQEILRGGVTPGKTPNDINIFVTTGGKKDEGDFESLEFFLGISKAAGMTEKGKGKSEAQLLIEQLDSLLAVVSETDSKQDKSKFTWKYYVPYFIELKKRNYVEPFGYFISQSSELAGVQEWLEANGGKVSEFLAWSKSFEWPKEGQ